MCEQCLVNPLFFGEILPNWLLIRARRESDDMEVGEWGLIHHANNPNIVFKLYNLPDDIVGEIKKELESMSETDIDFDDPLFDVKLTFRQRSKILADCIRTSIENEILSVNEYASLVFEAIKLGYDPGKLRFSNWLYDHLVEYIAKAEYTTDTVDPFPELDKVRAHNYSLGRELLTYEVENVSK